MGRNINPLGPLLAGIFRIPERRVRLDPEDIRAAGHYLDRLPERRFARYGLDAAQVRRLRERLAGGPR